MQRDNHGVRGSEVHLSPGEVEAATGGAICWNRADIVQGRCRADQLNEPIGVREYARRKQRMVADGFYDKKLD
jgi:hypothetical protein